MSKKILVFKEYLWWPLKLLFFFFFSSFRTPSLSHLVLDFFHTNIRISRELQIAAAIAVFRQIFTSTTLVHFSGRLVFRSHLLWRKMIGGKKPNQTIIHKVLPALKRPKEITNLSIQTSYMSSRPLRLNSVTPRRQAHNTCLIKKMYLPERHFSAKSAGDLKKKIYHSLYKFILVTTQLLTWQSEH